MTSTFGIKTYMTIYGRLNCTFTQQTIDWAKKEKNVNPDFNYKFIEIDKIGKQREDILNKANHNTLPGIFISFKYIDKNKRKQEGYQFFLGGYQDLLEYAPKIPGNMHRKLYAPKIPKIVIR